MRGRLCLLLFFLALPAVAADGQGFLYGRVVDEEGSVHEGRLRWSDEEACWGDFFNSTKNERPYLERIPKEQRRKGTPIKILGLTVGMSYDGSSGRSLKIRFGDIAEIRPRGGERARLVLRDGSELDVEGGSNDLGATIQVWEGEAEPAELDWDDIDRIEFAAAPEGFQPGTERLYGTVASSAGEFRGWIQWDQDEMLVEDELDGEGDDGTVALPMGRIRTIERDPHRGVKVVTREGEQLRLDGTNDVDDGNRGIFVDDERFGRVLVSWDAFERLDLTDPPGSGPSYDDFAQSGPLSGSVTETDGTVHSGRLVYDLDESESWEMLDGELDGVSYSIPMGRIGSIIPGEGSSRVVLDDGREIRLEEAADVGEGNDGVAVVGTAGQLDYVAWDRVRQIDFDGRLSGRPGRTTEVRRTE